MRGRGSSMPMERNPKMPEANGTNMESELRDLVHSSSAPSIVPKVQDYPTPAEAKMIGAAVSIAAHGVQEAIARRMQQIKTEAEVLERLAAEVDGMILQKSLLFEERATAWMRACQDLRRLFGEALGRAGSC